VVKTLLNSSPVFKNVHDKVFTYVVLLSKCEMLTETLLIFSYHLIPYRTRANLPTKCPLHRRVSQVDFRVTGGFPMRVSLVKTAAIGPLKRITEGFLELVSTVNFRKMQNFV
jgi:hypothetical protein